MIRNAKDNPIPVGGLPNMSDAISGWFQPLSFERVTKTVVNHMSVESLVTVNSRGMRQPLNPTRIERKPEEQRAWRWELLHILAADSLELDDIVIFNSVQYRVATRTDWAQYGYVEHEIVQDGS